MGTLIGLDKKMRELHKISLDVDIAYTPVFYDIETRGLNASEDKMIVFGSVVYGSGIGILFEKVDNENDLMVNTIKRLNTIRRTIKNPVLIGYNTYNFDEPFIVGRSIANGITPKIFKYMKQMDMYTIITRYLFHGSRLSMDRLLNRLNIENNDKYSGKDVLWLYNAERYDDIKEHCIYDMEKMIAVYDRLKPLFDWEYWRIFGCEKESDYDKTISMEVDSL